jgi:hypothetical protein
MPSMSVPDRILTIGDITLDPIRRRVEKVWTVAFLQALTHSLDILHALVRRDVAYLQ